MRSRLDVDLNAVLGTTGVAVVMLGAAQLVAAVTALASGEPWGALLAGAAGTALVGGLLAPLRRRAERRTRRESLATVVLAWGAATVAGAVPYWVTGVAGPVDGLFEATSGLTTTGASIFVDVDGLDVAPGEPPSGGRAPAPLQALHVWRCLTHWIGGAGIVLVVFVLTPFLSDALLQTQRSEASFLTVRYRGSTRSTLRGLLSLYVGLTAANALVLVALGVSVPDAVLHAGSTIATGGFSTHTASLATWGPAVQLATVAFMVVGALNFAVLGRAVEEVRQLARTQRAASGALRATLVTAALALPVCARAVWRNVETRSYVVLVLGASALLAAILVLWAPPRYGAVEGVGLALVDGTFYAASISTTTGFATEDFARWPWSAQAVLACLMLVGGCSGSTAGGLKMRRVLIVLLCVRAEVLRSVHPRGAFPLKLGGEVVTDEQAREALAFLGIYLLLALAAAVALTATGADLVTSVSAAASAFGSVGPGLGEVGPVANYQGVSPVAKVVLVAAMLLGRLEIYPVVNALTPSFWLRRAA